MYIFGRRSRPVPFLLIILFLGIVPGCSRDDGAETTGTEAVVTKASPKSAEVAGLTKDAERALEPSKTDPWSLSSTDMATGLLEPRKKAQLATVDQFEVFHDFSYSDRIAESGITFRSYAVDDAGPEYKPVHYDHGSGISVADVDQDGRYDVYLLTQLGENQLWRNLGDGKFENITTEAIALRDQVSVAAAFGDYDNDGDEDLFVTTVRHGSHLFQNQGGGKLIDVTQQSGLDYSGHSSAGVFFDYDNDSYLDLLLVNVGVYTRDSTGRGGYYVGMRDAFSGHLKPERYEQSILYHNEGGQRFRDVSAEVGLVDTSWSGDATIADFNDDGFQDLYIVNMQGDDHYYENVEGKKFVDKTEAYFPKTGWGAMGVKVFDYDNDGLFDLMTTDMHSDMSAKIGTDKEKLKVDLWGVDTEYLTGGYNNIFGNTFYHNLGGGKFEEISDKIGVETFWPWGLSVDDLNADGYDDILVTASMNYPWRYQVNSVLLNNRAKGFLDSEFIIGVEPRKDDKIETPWFEIDCGGADRKHPACVGLEPRKYTVMGALGTRSSAIFDLDDDGDLDIIMNDFHSAPQVLLSDLADRKKIGFLKVKLVGRTSNRNGIGAKVRVTAGGKTLSKILDGTSGYLSHSVLPLYFGLGDSDRVDRVEVSWPSGKSQTVKAPKANTMITITEM